MLVGRVYGARWGWVSGVGGAAGWGWVVYVWPVGAVQVRLLLPVWVICQLPWCLSRWCRRQSVIKFDAAVGPSGQGWTWSRSQRWAGWRQPGAVQRGSRALRYRAIAAGGR